MKMQWVVSTIIYDDGTPLSGLKAIQLLPETKEDSQFLEDQRKKTLPGLDMTYASTGEQVWHGACFVEQGPYKGLMTLFEKGDRSPEVALLVTGEALVHFVVAYAEGALMGKPAEPRMVLPSSERKPMPGFMFRHRGGVNFLRIVSKNPAVIDELLAVLMADGRADKSSESSSEENLQPGQQSMLIELRAKEIKVVEVKTVGEAFEALEKYDAFLAGDREKPED